MLAHILGITCQTNGSIVYGGIMKKLLIGLAVGAAVGMVVSELPKVRQALDKGKKKVKNMTK